PVFVAVVAPQHSGRDTTLGNQAYRPEVCCTLKREAGHAWATRAAAPSSRHRNRPNAGGWRCLPQKASFARVAAFSSQTFHTVGESAPINDCSKTQRFVCVPCRRDADV